MVNVLSECLSESTITCLLLNTTKTITTFGLSTLRNNRGGEGGSYLRGYAEIKFTRGAVIQRGQLFTDVSENTKSEDKRCPIVCQVLP